MTGSWSWDGQLISEMADHISGCMPWLGLGFFLIVLGGLLPSGYKFGVEFFEIGIGSRNSFVNNCRVTNADFPHMPSPVMSPFLVTLLRQSSVAAVYALLVWVVLGYIMPSGQSSIFFLASGFALAALLLGGKRYAWGVLLGALGANLLFGYSLETTIFKSVGSTLAALLGCWLLTRDEKFDRSLPTLSNYLRLLLLGGCAASIVSSVLGTTSLLHAGIISREAYAFGLISWWLGDMLGIVLLAAPCLLWLPRKTAVAEPRWIEVMLITLVTFMAGQVVFMEWFGGAFLGMQRGYWMFLFIFLAAVRLTPRWTALILLMVAVQAIWGAYRGLGLFAEDREAGYLNYWFYTVILSLVGMTLSIYLAQRQRAESELRQRTDELGLYNRILQQINQGESLSHVLNELAREVERLHPGMVCSILLLDADGRHLRHGAAPSLPDFYNQAADGLAIGEGVGACGTAVHRGELVIIDDVRQDSLWPADFQALARQAGVRSCWSQPIKDSRQRMVGTFVIYQARPAQPSSAEIALIGRMASLAARVIEQTQTQNDLRLKDAVLNASADATVIVDKSGRIEWINPAFSDLTGYGFSEVAGRDIIDIMKSAKHEPAYYQSIQRSILAGNVWHGELITTAKNGVEYDQDLKVAPIKNAAGEITHFVGVMRNITERKEAEQRIRTLAFYDALTHLPNRSLLDDRLKQAMAGSRRSGHYGALMFLDLDNFKPLNDAHGHGTGDLLLVEVARRISSCVRGTDTVARFGGDEFVVLLDGLDTARDQSADQAASVAEKIRLALAKPYVLTVRHEGAATITVEHHCTSSIGVVLFIDHENSADDVLKWADMAMYQAKDGGRNRVSFYAAPAQATAA
jgi:diguanylate cyclase (GGDEF)-like protein/PAS domain S-box-containing protein